MTKCKYCAEEMQSGAKFCTHCGKKQGMGIGLKLLLGIVGFVALVNVFDKISTPTPTPTPAVKLAAFKPELNAPPSGFRTIKWGSPVPAGLKKMTHQTPDGSAMYVPAVQGKSEPLLGIAISEEAYLFMQGRLYGGVAWIKGGDLNMIKAVLNKEFGVPSVSNTRMRIWKWTWPRSKIWVRLYQNGNSVEIMYNNDAI